MPLRCFIQQQAPVPGSAAQAVHYPACEWVSDEGVVDSWHPMNRFVCSWLTSDVSEVSRCEEVLRVLAQLENGTCPTWCVDGDAFCVDVQPNGVQFNASHVGPDDVAYWNQAEARFTPSQVSAALQAWRTFLAGHPQP